jgi:hypothetical protein
VSTVPSLTDEIILLPAERLRLIDTYITSATGDGGLGVAPNTVPWTRLESVFVLHDKEFNHLWIKSWSKSIFSLGVGEGELERVRGQVSLIHSLATITSLTFRTVGRIPRALLCLPLDLHALPCLPSRRRRAHILLNHLPDLLPDTTAADDLEMAERFVVCIEKGIEYSGVEDIYMVQLDCMQRVRRKSGDPGASKTTSSPPD